jgi:hypothetical protein
LGSASLGCQFGATDNPGFSLAARHTEKLPSAPYTRNRLPLTATHPPRGQVELARSSSGSEPRRLCMATDAASASSRTNIRELRRCVRRDRVGLVVARRRSAARQMGSCRRPLAHVAPDSRDSVALGHLGTYTGHVAQLTIYLPEAVVRKLRAGARRARKSVSAYVSDLLERRDRPAKWPSDFRRLYGSCDGTLPEVDDVPPEPGPDL